MISRNLWHIPKDKPLKAVRLVLSLGGFFCDVPHLTTSNKNEVVGNKKLSLGANVGLCLESLGRLESLGGRKSREFSEVGRLH